MVVPSDRCNMPGHGSTEQTYCVPASRHAADPSRKRIPALMVWDRSNTVADGFLLTGAPLSEPTNSPASGARSKFQPLSVDAPASVNTVARGCCHTTFAPSTGEKIADVAKAGREDAQLAIEAARDAFDNGPWPRM